MNCEKARDAMILFLHNELESGDEELAAHIAGCQKCHALFGSLRETASLVSRMPKLQLTADAAGRIRREIYRKLGSPVSPKAKGVPLCWLGRVAFAAAVLLLFFIFIPVKRPADIEIAPDLAGAGEVSIISQEEISEMSVRLDMLKADIDNLRLEQRSLAERLKRLGGSMSDQKKESGRSSDEYSPPSLFSIAPPSFAFGGGASAACIHEEKSSTSVLG